MLISLLKSASNIKIVAKIAVKLRNQCHLLVGRHLGGSSNFIDNGELLVLDTIAANCHVFIDVGANSGNWAKAFSERNPNAQGFLFDPSSQCAQKLRKEFIEPQYSVKQVALADYAGTTRFIEEDYLGETSAIAAFYQSSGKPGHETVVEVNTLDHFFSNCAFGIDYLKIDTEGSDNLVIKGCSRMLSKQCIKMIQFEYNSAWREAGATLLATRNHLAYHGFSLYLIRKNGLYTLDIAKWGEYYHYSNFLACGDQHLDLIRHIIRGDL